MRRVLGVDVSTSCRRIRAVPVAARGNGLHMSVRVGRPVSVDLPARAANLREGLNRRPPTTDFDPFTALVELQSLLTEHVAIAAQEAAGANGSALGELLAIGVVEPGKITETREGTRGYMESIDSARLADLSGLNVVSGFPARDLATGGNGGPLDPLPLWLLFRSAHCDRIFVDFGRKVRLVRVPQLTGSLASVSGLSFRQTQGTALVDLLVQQLTGGRKAFDAGGRLAVQGRRVDELVEHWMDHQGQAAECVADGDAPSMLRSALAMAVERGWSVYDTLCSATHFVAESAAAAAERLVRQSNPTELILSGGGVSNGLILRHFSAKFSRHTVRRIEQLGGHCDVVAPAVAGVLTLLHLDQVPANVAGLTGGETPRVLGKLTPGGAQAWQSLLASCSSGGHSIRPLRAAM